MAIQHAAEVGVLALGGVASVAQLNGVDVGADTGLLADLIKLGATGVLGFICYLLIRENRKAVVDAATQHKAAVEAQAKTFQEIMQRVVQASEHQASTAAATVSSVEASHRDTIQRLETAVAELFRVQREVTEKTAASLSAISVHCAETLARKTAARP